MAGWPFARRRRVAEAAPAGGATLFFATDLHGSEACFRKFLNAGRIYGADLLVLGGDIAGKFLVPIVAQAGGRFRADWEGRRHDLAAGELAPLERAIADAGGYSRRVTPEQLAPFADDDEAAAELIDAAVAERLERWIDLAEDKLAGTDLRVLFAPGNDDPAVVDEVLERRADGRLRLVEGEIVELAPGLEMLCTGYTNVTPWHTLREFPEPEIRERIDAMAARLSDPAAAIFNIHVPPHDTRLDTARLVAEDLTLVRCGAYHVEKPVGSTAVRAAIGAYQPLLSLHGHIHESAGTARLGRTLAVNPGSDYARGLLCGLVATLDRGRVHRAQLLIG